MSAPEPTITGDLEKTPFLHIMVNLSTRALTGTLALWPETDVKGQDRIRVQAGVPQTARLLSAESASLERALLPLFGRRRGAFAFYEGQDLVGEGAIHGRVEPYALFAAALRVSARADAMEAVLSQYESTALRLAPGVDIKRYHLLAQENRLIEVIRAGPGTPAELVSGSELGGELGRRILYLLLITRALVPYAVTTPVPAAGSSTSGSHPAVGSTTSTGRVSSPPEMPARPSYSQIPAQRASLPPPGGSQRPPPPQSEPPPANLSAEHLAMFQETRARLKAMDKQNYFDMLGIAKEVSSDGVRKAFIQLAKRWHPDRLPSELSVLRPDAERIFHHLNVAHDTLVDDAKRAQHLRNVQEGGGTPEADRKLNAIVTAAMEQQKAEVLMKRRDFVGAQALLEHALTLSTEDADLYATYGWALLNVENNGGMLPDILRALDRALAISPVHDRAHLYKGLALRRLGKEAEAISHFKKAAEANPRNVDATREVRIARMRGQLAPETPKEPPKQEGIFAKLFGSSKKKT